MASVEPSGLLIEGNMPSEEFSIWTDKFIFINLASEALKFEVKNTEAENFPILSGLRPWKADDR